MSTPIAKGMFAISAGLFEEKHLHRMGPAIWVYGYLLGRVTEEIPDGNGDFIGIVAHGEPISATEIATRLGKTVWSIRADLRRLDRGGYITKKISKSGESYSYLINKSKKFLPKRNGTHAENSQGYGTTARPRARNYSTRCRKLHR
jgi:hypothetical protein